MAVVFDQRLGRRHKGHGLLPRNWLLALGRREEDKETMIDQELVLEMCHEWEPWGNRPCDGVDVYGEGGRFLCLMRVP